MNTKNIIILIVLLFTLYSCTEPSSIRVQNNLTKVTLKNVKWGDIGVTNNIIPGEISQKLAIYPDDYTHDIELPEKFKVNFYMEYHGDLIYLETMQSYELGKESNITISIQDTTQVYNKAIDKVLSFSQINLIYK